MFFFRNRQNKLKESFYQYNDVVFYNEVCSVIEAFGHQQFPTEWRLFIDISKGSLQAVFLHNGNKFPYVSIVHVAYHKIV
jgi:hypothetical protein